MLFAAGHAKNDIPSVLNTYAARHGVEITYGRELGVDLKMLRAAGDRVEIYRPLNFDPMESRRRRAVHRNAFMTKPQNRPKRRKAKLAAH